MTDIVLFRPKINQEPTGRCPLGLVYIATPLVNSGFSVKIIDEEVSADWHDELAEALGSSTICAGASVMTGMSIKSALDFSRAVKENYRIPIVWGGIHPTLLAEQTLKNQFVDIVVKGEGEQKFLEVVKLLKNKKDLDGVKGIAFKKNGKIYFSEPEINFLDLNKLPAPDFSLIDVDYYKKICDKNFSANKSVLEINSDRGCPHRCSFCYNININNRKWRAIKAEKILDIIEGLRDKYNVGGINFVSDNFFIDKKRVYQICKGLIERGIIIEWHADIRIDTFLDYEDNTIEIIKKSGCKGLYFGVESGSPRILKLINKDIELEDVFKADRRALSFGFRRSYHFMMGFPEETKEDVQKTIRVIDILARDKNVNFIGPVRYTPYPGTPLYNICQGLGFVPPANLEGWIDYEWDKLKLPFLSEDFKDYLNIVSTACRIVYRDRGKKSLAGRFVRLRFKLALIVLLLFGVKAFNLVIKTWRILKHILQ